MNARFDLLAYLQGFGVLLLGLLILLVDFHTLPSAAKESALGFSAQRAAVDIEQIAKEPHPAGSSSHERVKQELVEKLRGLSLEPSIQRSVGITEVANRVTATPVSNILACVPGRAPSGSILLTAHYDSVQTGPGGGDDGAGVATILEILRALQRRTPLRNDLLILFTDGEEHNLAGAEAFASTNLTGKWKSPCSAPKMDLNFDNRGDRGPVYLFETGASNAGLVRAYARTSKPYGSSLSAAAHDLIPNNTDFSVFKNAGLTGLNFAMVDGFQTYHTTLDTAGRVDQRSVQQIGSNLVTLLLNIGNAPLDQFTMTKGDSIFFNLLAGWMVRYPMNWNWPLETASGILLMVVLCRSRRGLRSVAVLASCLAVLFSSLLSAVSVGFGTALLLRRVGDRLLPGNTTSNLLLLCGLVAASLTMAVVLRRGWRSLVSAPTARAGVLLALWGLSLWPQRSFLVAASCFSGRWSGSFWLTLR